MMPPIIYRLLGVLVFLSATFFAGLITGREQVQDKWDAAVVKQSLTTAAVKVAQAEATTKTVTEYVDRVKTVRVAGATIIKEVPKYVPISTCSLPGGFRLLHDAAAAGDATLAAGSSDAPSVDYQTLTETVADNYTACRLNAEQLTAIQGWVRAERSVVP